MEFLMTWGAAIGVFVTTGTLMTALNTTIGAEAGSPGMKGVWYVWKRFFLLPIGAGLGAMGALVGLSSPIGEGIGYGTLDGLIAAFVAGQSYGLVVGTVKAKLRHRLKADPPE